MKPLDFFTFLFFSMILFLSWFISKLGIGIINHSKEASLISQISDNNFIEMNMTHKKLTIEPEFELYIEKLQSILHPPKNDFFLKLENIKEFKPLVPKFLIQLQKNLYKLENNSFQSNCLEEEIIRWDSLFLGTPFPIDNFLFLSLANLFKEKKFFFKPNINTCCYTTLKNTFNLCQKLYNKTLIGNENFIILGEHIKLVIYPIIYSECENIIKNLDSIYKSEVCMHLCNDQINSILKNMNFENIKFKILSLEDELYKKFGIYDPKNKTIFYDKGNYLAFLENLKFSDYLETRKFEHKFPHFITLELAYNKSIKMFIIDYFNSELKFIDDIFSIWENNIEEILLVFLFRSEFFVEYVQRIFLNVPEPIKDSIEKGYKMLNSINKKNGKTNSDLFLQKSRIKIHLYIFIKRKWPFFNRILDFLNYFIKTEVLDTNSFDDELETLFFVCNEKKYENISEIVKPLIKRVEEYRIIENISTQNTVTFNCGDLKENGFKVFLYKDDTQFYRKIGMITKYIYLTDVCRNFFVRQQDESLENCNFFFIIK